jgi:hypothetical protein
LQLQETFMQRPKLSIRLILAWADRFHQATGSWPKTVSGPVADSPADSWLAIDAALCQGGRGLAGGSSLARLLAEQRNVRNRSRLPRLTEELILGWADRHFRLTGQWPSVLSQDAGLPPGERWDTINQRLFEGGRGLPGGNSLAKLLAGRRKAARRPDLTERQILVWAKAFQERCGYYPNGRSGQIAESTGDSWYTVDKALREGLRGLPGGSSLAELLAGRNLILQR